MNLMAILMIMQTAILTMKVVMILLVLYLQ